MYIYIYVMMRDLAGVVLGYADCAIGVLLAFFCYTQAVLDIHMQGAQHRLLLHRGLVVEASPDRLVHLEGEGAVAERHSIKVSSVRSPDAIAAASGTTRATNAAGTAG